MQIKPKPTILQIIERISKTKIVIIYLHILSSRVNIKSETVVREGLKKKVWNFFGGGIIFKKYFSFQLVIGLSTVWKIFHNFFNPSLRTRHIIVLKVFKIQVGFLCLSDWVVLPVKKISKNLNLYGIKNSMLSRTKRNHHS